jgi:hypothetical protein
MLENKGWGNASFLSLCTGLNIAIAKIEAFSKSLTDVDTRFEEIKKQQLNGTHVGTSLADEMMLVIFTTASNRILNEATIKNRARWLRARKASVYCSYIGGAAIFFQVSLGFLGILLLWPLWETWVSKKQSSREIKDKLDELIKTFEPAASKIAAESTPRKQEILKSLEQDQPNP